MTHTYENRGEYTIKITGDLHNLYHRYTFSNEYDQNKLNRLVGLLLLH